MPKNIIVDRNIDVRMRDGTLLRADMYRPTTDEPLPVLLNRTPYGKAFSPSSNTFALMAAERGYVVLIQDTRGCFASEGEDYPLVSEKDDGFDTIEWASQQSWSNGKVGMFGASYVGYTQLAAAVTQPPALKAIIPEFTFCNPYTMSYNGGAMNLGLLASWGLTHRAMARILRYHSADKNEQRCLDETLVKLIDGMAQGSTLSFLPLADFPLIGKNGIDTFFYDNFEHLNLDDFWQRVICPYEKIGVPALFISGWYDCFINNSLSDFMALSKSQQNKLIIGPWTHGVYDNHVGEIDFGMQASIYRFQPDELRLRWFDTWLKGIDNGMKNTPPIRLFIMGDNYWRDEREWPPKRAQQIAYYLHSAGNANTLSGNGVLTIEKPSQEPVDYFIYDPRNPVPTQGGGLCCYDAALTPGAYDQRSIEARPDVLVYTTPPLEKDLEVTGSIRVQLWASSNAPDTDFTAKLVDVGSCGCARNLTDGIIRASCRQPGKIEQITPGQIYQYCIDVAATSNVFKRGHRIRLEISSSNFPRFDRNLNTGKVLGQDDEMIPALQTVFHDDDHPSSILLPVISLS